MRSAAVAILIFFFSILLDTISSSIFLSAPPLSRMLVTHLTLSCFVAFSPVFPLSASFQIYFISSLKYLKIARTPLFRARKSFEGVSWEWVLLNSYDAQAAAQQGRIHPALLQQGPLPHSCK